MQDASREYRALANARRKGWVPICVGRRSPSPHPPRAFVPTVRLFLGSWPLYHLCQSLVAVDCVCDWEYNSSRARISQPDRSIRQHRLPSPLPLPIPKKKRRFVSSVVQSHHRSFRYRPLADCAREQVPSVFPIARNRLLSQVSTPYPLNAVVTSSLIRRNATSSFTRLL